MVDSVNRRVGILGAGAVGARVARQLLVTDPKTEVLLQDPDAEKVRSLTRRLGGGAAVLVDGHLEQQGIDLLVVAAPCGQHVHPIQRCLKAGIPAISTSDRIEDVTALLNLETEALAAGVPVLAGVGFAPGLTCILAAFLGAGFDVVDEVHMAKQGTGGPACARQHHRALKNSARDWRDGGWIWRPGGSGRELVWFPDPIGGSDCYRAALPDALLVRPQFTDAVRVTVRMAARRRDRFTAWLPMLRPPHPEGALGAIRVELRGRVGGKSVVRVAGAVEHPAIAAAAVVATAADAVLGDWDVPAGVRGLAGAMDARRFLRSLVQRGVVAQEFAGLGSD